VIGYLERRDHAEAVSELAEYAQESRIPPTFLAIGGWPALQRVQLVERPHHNNEPLPPDPMMVQITTAVAAGNLLVRLEGKLPSDADQKLKDVVLAIGQSLLFRSTGDPTQVQQELNQLRSSPQRPNVPQGAAPLTGITAPLLGPLASTPIFPSQQLGNGFNGELEVAISNNGTNIVVVKQSGWITSNDGGQTFPFTGGLNVSDGDSSIAFGQSGNFYHAALSCFGASCQPPCPGASPSGAPPSTSNCAVVALSTDNGKNFGGLVANGGLACPNSGAGACSIDQEHIVADRTIAGAGGADRVYMAYRDLSGNVNVTCSPDSGVSGGNNWAPRLALEGGSDFPRVNVGGDGSFYVVYVLGGNTDGATIRLDKFNACTTSAAVMTRAAGGFPRTVSTFTNFAGCGVANGFGGLDRCNGGGNILSGPTVTVDDTTATHVYVAWAANTAANNENVTVADSTDGGVTWNAAGHTPVTVNTNVNARRYHPWSCATGGNAFVTWYDRRAATAAGASNDLTDFFAASASLPSGTLVRNNDEFQISAASDPQCNTWPAAPRTTFDSENCSVQPQLAGVCSVNTGTRCDFSNCAGGGGVGACECPAKGETCNTGNGAVKYGDYNGNACVLGRLCTVFASSVGRNDGPVDYFACFVVAPTPTTITYTGVTTADFHDPAPTSATLTLSGTSAPVANQKIKFTIGGQSCSAMTNTSGVASCSPPIILTQVPGLPYTVTASFAGLGNFQASSASKPFTITREETTTTYTGPTVIANGVLTTFSAVLLEDGDPTKPISGRTITITLGTGATMQSCSGMTIATGTASCPILVNQPLGAGTVAAKFAGDAFYLPSSASANTILFAFLAHGSFVLGDKTAVVGPNPVTFWSATWSSQNVLSGGSAPASFKGFASAISTNPPACGDTWTSRPGNSSRPPAKLPSFMGVVVSTAVNKSGSTLSGNVPAIVVVQTNPGYAPDPGHPGTGSVVAVFCH
jgi:hypothetical protein